MKILYYIILLSLFASLAFSASVTLSHKNAVVWSQDQVIHGRVSSFLAPDGTLFVAGDSIYFTIAVDSTFSVPVHLGQGMSTIVARVDSAGVLLFSDTLRFTLGYKLKPVADAYATVAGRIVTLHGSVVENPRNDSLAFSWSQDSRNAQLFTMSNHTDSVASVSIPLDAPHGEYYFDLLASPVNNDTVSGKARTFVTVDSLGIHPFNIKTDHARWIDSAIIYEITPYIFVGQGKYRYITRKMGEIASLGVNTIWLQPVYATRGGGQGYDVIDYFALRSDLGTEAELQTLVQTAHAYGLRVMFDFVPNHSAVSNYYAVDANQYGAQSHYYDFYQRTKNNSSVPYSANENLRTVGQMSFVYYFWTDLVNLNYDNHEVQRMIIEAGKYWIEKFDIDGYRVDAVWGPNARKPGFMKQWRIALKRIKPEALLLAEDKAAQSQVFDEKFDAAYDWTAEYDWVSHWIWQAYYNANSNPTIFNYTPANLRANALRQSLNNNGAGYAPNAKILRFLENNDTYRFLATHDLARTKMAAALIFSLNGIPLIYNGQEVGAATHPYSTYEIFEGAGSMQSSDTQGLWPYYQRLAHLRTMFPALYDPNIQEVPVTPNASLYAFRRWSGAQNLVTVLNMASTAATGSLRLPVLSMNLDPAKTYYLSDLLSSTVISGTPSDLDTISVQMNPYSTRVFVLADTQVVITDVRRSIVDRRPLTFGLAQNYPNPFNPSTKLDIQIAKTEFVTLKIYDILGREVATLVNDMLQPGSYTYVFDGSNLASGMYFYRMQAGAFVETRKMLLLK